MKIIYQPFVRDEDVNIPLLTSNLLFDPFINLSTKEITSESESEPTSEETRYVNPLIVNTSKEKLEPISESTSEEKIEEPKTSFAHQFKYSDTNIGNMQPILDIFKKYNIPIRITSGKRNGIGPSHHNSGNAIDFTPIDYNNNKEIDSSD